MSLSSKFSTSFLLASSLILAGCGGGGGGGSDDGGIETLFNGNQSEATATASNSDDLATAAVEAVTQSLSTGSTSAPPSGIVTTSFDIEGLLNSELEKILSTGALPTGLTQRFEGSCGGYYEITTPDEEDFSPSRLTYRSTVDYVNFCQGTTGSTVVVNGRAVIVTEFNSNFDLIGTEADYDVTYTVTVLGEVSEYELRGYQVCNAEFVCTFSSDFVGVTGRTYRLEEVDIDGDDVDATVYDSTYGRIEIDSNGLSQCDNGNFDSSGTITIYDSTGEAVIVITFDGCNGDCVVTYDGTVSRYPQLFSDD